MNSNDGIDFDLLFTLKTTRQAGELQIRVAMLYSCRQFNQNGARCRPLSTIQEVMPMFFISIAGASDKTSPLKTTTAVGYKSDNICL
jgi:hypothetical protein